jgi:glycine oxidase
MTSASTIILGAGAAGCATAYFLAKRGLKPVVIEKDAIADHASGFAFGGLTPYTVPDRPGPEYPLLRAAIRLHAELAEELRGATGIDTGFGFAPHVVFAEDEHERAELEAALPWLVAEGFPAEWLDGEAVRRLEPRLAPDLLGALHVTGSALVESYRYTLSLAQAAEQAGAEIRHGEVVGLEVERGRVTGVRTRSATLACEAVVVALGPWSGPASQWLGVRVPVRPLKGQIVRLRLPGSRLEGRFGWRKSYFATKGDGMIWAGTTEEEAGFDETLTEAARDEILLPLARFFPPLMDAEIVQQTACLRPVSADGAPIVGRAPGVKGLFVATAGGRKGILMSPALGRIAADLVVDGRTELLDAAPYSLERFGGVEARA